MHYKNIFLFSNLKLITGMPTQKPQWDVIHNCIEGVIEQEFCHHAEFLRFPNRWNFLRASNMLVPLHPIEHF